jgi:hypothetical protein
VRSGYRGLCGAERQTRPPCPTHAVETDKRCLLDGAGEWQTGCHIHLRLSCRELRQSLGGSPIETLGSIVVLRAVPAIMMPMAFAVGQTAVIVPVGAAEPIVGRRRTRFDPAAATGVPAHVTIIYPFLSGQDID